MNILKTFWPAGFGWQHLLTQLPSLVPGSFLLLLAGIISTQYHRKPREVRLLWIAIALKLASGWGLDRVITFALKVCYDVAGFQSPWIGFGLNTISTLLGILLSGLCWWCIIQAVFCKPRLSQPERIAEHNT